MSKILRLQVNFFILIVSCFVLVVLLSTCKHVNSYPITYVQQETKDFTFFQPGTWWEYKNLKTNELDTWRVLEVSEVIAGDEETSNGKYQTLSIQLNSYYYNSFKMTINDNFCSISTVKNNTALVQHCFFKSISNELDACDNNYIKLINTDSLNNVLTGMEFEVYPSPCTNIFPKHFWWKRHIGLEKMISPSGDTLTLVSYNIKQ